MVSGWIIVCLLQAVSQEQAPGPLLDAYSEVTPAATALFPGPPTQAALHFPDFDWNDASQVQQAPRSTSHYRAGEHAVPASFAVDRIADGRNVHARPARIQLRRADPFVEPLGPQREISHQQGGRPESEVQLASPATLGWSEGIETTHVTGPAQRGGAPGVGVDGTQDASPSTRATSPSTRVFQQTASPTWVKGPPPLVTPDWPLPAGPVTRRAAVAAPGRGVSRAAPWQMPDPPRGSAAAAGRWTAQPVQEASWDAGANDGNRGATAAETGLGALAAAASSANGADSVEEWGDEPVASGSPARLPFLKLVSASTPAPPLPPRQQTVAPHWGHGVVGAALKAAHVEAPCPASVGEWGETIRCARKPPPPAAPPFPPLVPSPEVVAAPRSRDVLANSTAGQTPARNEWGDLAV